jgi:16S rRNA (guanine1516-N2)-methyltransferase
MLVVSSVPELREKAVALSQTLALPYVLEPPSGLVLHVCKERLELREAHAKTGPVYVDFADLKHRPKQGKDLIAKAVGVKGSYRPTVLDATAGLGQDAFILASYGCEVRMYERSPVIYALLEDGLRRARADKTLSDIVGRMSLSHGDAKLILSTLSQDEKPDVIYLDPMYPESGKTAAKRKEMRFFRELVGDDLDVQEVFEAALGTALNRVVLKRPLKAPTFAKPSHVLAGKTVRFDIYVIPKGEKSLQNRHEKRSLLSRVGAQGFAPLPCGLP